MKKYNHLKNITKNDKFDALTERELSFLTGGANSPGSVESSQTSNTGSGTAKCCDATCVCTCTPPIVLLPLPSGTGK